MLVFVKKKDFIRFRLAKNSKRIVIINMIFVFYLQSLNAQIYRLHSIRRRSAHVKLEKETIKRTIICRFQKSFDEYNIKFQPKIL